MNRNESYCSMSHTREGFQFESVTEDNTERQELQKMLSDLHAIFPPSRDGAEKTILTMHRKTAYRVLQNPPDEGLKESRCTCVMLCYRLDTPPKEIQLNEKQEVVCGEFIHRLLWQDPPPDFMVPDFETAELVYAMLASVLPPISLLERRLTCCIVCGQSNSPTPPVPLEQLRLLAGLLKECKLSQEEISLSGAIAASLTEITQEASPAMILSYQETVGFLYQHLNCVENNCPALSTTARLLCAAAGHPVELPTFKTENLLLYYMDLDMCPIEQAVKAENILQQCQHIKGSDKMYSQATEFLAESKHSVEWIIRAAFLNQLIPLSGDSFVHVMRSPSLCEMLLTALFDNPDRPAVSFLRNKWNIGTKKITSSIAVRMFFLGLMKESRYHQLFDKRESALLEFSKLLELDWKPGPTLQKTRTYRQAVRHQLWKDFNKSIHESFRLLRQLAHTYWR